MRTIIGAVADLDVRSFAGLARTLHALSYAPSFFCLFIQPPFVLPDISSRPVSFLSLSSRDQSCDRASSSGRPRRCSRHVLRHPSRRPLRPPRPPLARPGARICQSHAPPAHRPPLLTTYRRRPCFPRRSYRPVSRPPRSSDGPHLSQPLSPRSSL